MKLIYILFISLALSSCKFSTDEGSCIGFFSKEDPELSYEVSTRNLVWTFLGGASVIIPVMWAAVNAKCPVEKK